MLCLLPTHLISSQIKMSADSRMTTFFKAEWNCIPTWSLIFIYSCSCKSHIMRTARSPALMLHDITTNTASIDSSVILNQCPSHGITLFFAIKNTVQSEWWPVQQFFRLLTNCYSYSCKILNITLWHYFLGFISVYVQYNFIFHSKYLYGAYFLNLVFLSIYQTEQDR